MIQSRNRLPQSVKRGDTSGALKRKSRTRDPVEPIVNLAGEEFRYRPTWVCANRYSDDFMTVAFESLRGSHRLGHMPSAISLYSEHYFHRVWLVELLLDHWMRVPLLSACIHSFSGDSRGQLRSLAPCPDCLSEIGTIAQVHYHLDAQVI